MSEVVFAAESINNQLSAKDLKTIEQVKSEGKEVHLVYYLYRVPAESTVLPSTQERVSLWHEEATKRLSELGNKLGIPQEHRHFVDEIIGPDEVFQEARDMHVTRILTHNPEELKPRFLTRLLQGVKDMFDGKHEEPKVVDIKQLQPQGQGAYAESGAYRPRTGASIHTIGKGGPQVNQDIGEEKDKDIQQEQRPKFKR